MTANTVPQPAQTALVRLAAVGDLHLAVGRAGSFRPALLRLRHHADVLLLAGDLTEHGTAEQAAFLAAELRDLGVPTIAVLGNHDHLAGRAGAAHVATTLAEAGVDVLDGTGMVCTVGGVRLGVAGTMGFGGGFDPAGADARADRFAAALAGLDCDIRVALTHYAPTVDTLTGERPDLHPVLGCAALGAAIDAAGTNLAVHGHAHHGREHGTTPGGVAVRNVAYPVIRCEARLYHLRLRPDRTAQITTIDRDRIGAWMRWSTRRSADLAARTLRHTHDTLTPTGRTGRGGRRG